MMLLFSFPQETQLDKISPTVLVILIISMASLSRDAFLCLCVPVLSASFPRSLQQGPKGAQRMMKGCSKVAYAFVTLLITYSSAANSFTTLYVHPPCFLRLHLFSSLQRLAYLMPYIIAQPPVSWLSPFLSPI